MSRGALAAAYVVDIGDGYFEVVNVVTARDYRRQGLQRELWSRLLADADAEGATLVLGVAHPSTGMKHSELRAWYERMGFESRKDRSMERQPQGADDSGWPDVSSRATLREPGGAGRPTEGAPR